MIACTSKHTRKDIIIVLIQYADSTCDPGLVVSNFMHVVDVNMLTVVAVCLVRIHGTLFHSFAVNHYCFEIQSQRNRLSSSVWTVSAMYTPGYGGVP